jgi:hypothetical protein
VTTLIGISVISDQWQRRIVSDMYQIVLNMFYRHKGTVLLKPHTYQNGYQVIPWETWPFVCTAGIFWLGMKTMKHNLRNYLYHATTEQLNWVFGALAVKWACRNHKIVLIKFLHPGGGWGLCFTGVSLTACKLGRHWKIFLKGQSNEKVCEIMTRDVNFYLN